MLMRAAHISRKWHHYFGGVPVGGGGVPAYYVNGATGNDTTGDGTLATPWKTIHKAITSVPDIECNIKVAAGTYKENSGADYLYIQRSFSHRVTIEPQNTGDTVIVSDNNSGGYTINFGASANVRFRNVTVKPQQRQTVAVVFFNNAAISNIEFDTCTITTIATGGVGYSIRVNTLTNTISNVKFSNCLIDYAAGADSDFRSINVRVGDGGNLDFHLLNCTIAGRGYKIIDWEHAHANAISKLTIVGGSYSIDGADPAVAVHGGTVDIRNATFYSEDQIALLLGQDGAGTYTTTGTVSGSTITSDTSHAFLVGGKCSNVVCSGLTVNGGDYGAVFKECADCSITESTLDGGSVSPLYFKAAVRCSATDNDISDGGLYNISVGKNLDTGTLSGDLVVTGNTVLATGSGDALKWGDADNDSGGSVCDLNTYDISGTTGNLGSVYGTAGITSLAALQAAWSTYDVTTNDANSTVID